VEPNHNNLDFKWNKGNQITDINKSRGFLNMSRFKKIMKKVERKSFVLFCYEKSS